MVTKSFAGYSLSPGDLRRCSAQDKRSVVSPDELALRLMIDIGKISGKSLQQIGAGQNALHSSIFVDHNRGVYRRKPFKRTSRTTIMISSATISRPTWKADIREGHRPSRGRYRSTLRLRRLKGKFGRPFRGHTALP